MSSTPPVGPYTPVYKAGDFLFVSGQVGLADGVLVDGFEAQARQSLANLKGQLESQSSSLNSVVKTTVFITDMANYAVMNEIYLEFFADNRPARSAVAAAALPLGAEFEIEAVAYVG